MKFLRTQWLDFLFFCFVPCIAAMLPWSLSSRWLKFWSRREWGPFDESARTAASIAPAYLDIGDARVFRANMRLVWLLDCCDMYLSLLRPRKWWPHHVGHLGAWPQLKAFAVAGFHYSAALFVLPSLRSSGFESQLVSARFDRRDYQGLPVRYWQAKLRSLEVKRLCGHPMAFRPGVREQMMRALAANVCVIGVLDMPPRLAPRGQRPVRLLDQVACLPDGLLGVAREANVPVVPYWVEVDLDTCTRRICIGEPLDPADVTGSLQALADILDRQIRRTPSAWMFWREWPTWIADAAALRDGHPPPTSAQGIQYEAPADTSASG
jgi:hypothetical protein